MRQSISKVFLLASFVLFLVGCNEEPPRPGLQDTASEDAAAADAEDGSSDTASADAGGEVGPTDSGGEQGDASDEEVGDTGADTNADTGADSGADTGVDTGVDGGDTMDSGAECSGPDPSACGNCPSGEVCMDDPNSCDPSSCQCVDGKWACTDDCGGEVCTPKPSSCSKPDPSGCKSNADCKTGEVCKDDPNSCDPSTCQCSNGKWACTKDCAGTVCMPKSNSCTKPDPSGCETNADCKTGEVCKDDPNSCDPSTCKCSNGKWACTNDCAGTVCMPKSSNSCSGPDPSGCKSNADCMAGEVCKDDPGSCDPSVCKCANGRWVCTADCGGTVCTSP